MKFFFSENASFRVKAIAKYENTSFLDAVATDSQLIRNAVAKRENASFQISRLLHFFFDRLIFLALRFLTFRFDFPDIIMRSFTT